MAVEVAEVAQAEAGAEEAVGGARMTLQHLLRMQLTPTMRTHQHTSHCHQQQQQLLKYRPPACSPQQKAGGCSQCVDSSRRFLVSSDSHQQAAQPAQPLQRLAASLQRRTASAAAPGGTCMRTRRRMQLRMLATAAAGMSPLAQAGQPPQRQPPHQRLHKASGCQAGAGAGDAWDRLIRQLPLLPVQAEAAVAASSWSQRLTSTPHIRMHTRQPCHHQPSQRLMGSMLAEGRPGGAAERVAWAGACQLRMQGSSRPIRLQALLQHLRLHLQP